MQLSYCNFYYEPLTNWCDSLRSTYHVYKLTCHYNMVPQLLKYGLSCDTHFNKILIIMWMCKTNNKMDKKACKQLIHMFPWYATYDAAISRDHIIDHQFDYTTQILLVTLSLNLHWVSFFFFFSFLWWIKDTDIPCLYISYGDD